MPAQLLRFFMNIWPPFFGAGIKILTLSKDYRYAMVRLRMGIFNRNIVGVHFGGSLFAMTDPFFMIMVQQNLGKEYVVWDRAAKIDFVKPGRGNVHAEFSISAHELEELKSAAQHGAKVLRDFTVEVKDSSNEVVAVIVKTIYVRQKRKI
jgi:acyl-coenzyme A thioesterase PaaI-like protein